MEPNELTFPILNWMETLPAHMQECYKTFKIEKHCIYITLPASNIFLIFNAPCN